MTRWPSLRTSARLYCSSDECRKRLIRKRMPGARPCLIAAGETGKNGRHALVGLLRQSVFSRLAGRAVIRWMSGECKSRRADVRIGARIACNHRQAEHVIEFAIGQQSGIRGHHRAAKLEHETAVKIEPESPTIRFTRRVRHDRSLNARISY
jgi:hypothetical protein